MLSPVTSYTLFWADLTKLGSAAVDSARQICRIIAEGIAQKPDRTVGIIIAPNCGSHKAKYDDDSMEQCISKVEQLLGPDQPNNNGIQLYLVTFAPAI